MLHGTRSHRERSPSMQNRRKLIRNSGLVLSAAALGGVAACTSTDTGGGGGDGDGDLLSRLQEAGTITVGFAGEARSEEHTSELQSRGHLVCRLLLEKKK